MVQYWVTFGRTLPDKNTLNETFELKALCIRAIEEAETRERKMGKENWLHCRIDKHHSVSYRLSLMN